MYIEDLKPSPKPERHRLDRELSELLQELRVVQGGVLILVGFLLVIPFTQRFVSVNSFEKAVYFATLIAAGTSAIMIVAPVSYHRVVFRQRDKQALLTHSNALVMIGLGLFALTIVGVITLVSDFVFSVTLTVIADSLFLLCVALLWYLLPLRSRRDAVERLRRSEQEASLRAASGTSGFTRARQVPASGADVDRNVA